MAADVRDLAFLRVLLQQSFQQRHCCHCTFWDPFDIPQYLYPGSDPTLIEYSGLCRRRPPERVPDEEKGWPTTEHYDWCGEFGLDKRPELLCYIESLEKASHAQPADEQP